MYQIWIPNATSLEALDRVGLSDLCRAGESGPAITEFLASGPDGGAGLLVEFFGNTGKVNTSHWEPCWGDRKRGLAPGRFWWGFPAGQERLSLAPTQLAFKSQVQSHSIRMADGQYWSVPNMVLLPHRLTLDPVTGESVRKIAPNWAHLYSRMTWAMSKCELAIEDDAVAYRDECCDYLVEVLQVNYRVNRELVYRLELFDDDNWFQLVAWTVDRDRLRAIAEEVSQKKTASIKPG